jgi:tetratricopeptide (TPR) repeat protein
VTSRAPAFYCFLLALVLAAPALAAPTDTQPQKFADVRDAIDHLGSADPAERDAATKYLSGVGEAAEAALREVAGGDDVEAARRATELLRQIRFGIRPDTPKVVIDLLAQYRQVPPGPDRQAIAPLVKGMVDAGPAGLRVVARLWREEADEGRRRFLGQALAERARPAAAVLLADRDNAAAVELLDVAADAGSAWAEAAVRDLSAALLLQNGGAGLDERVAKLKPLVATPAGAEQVRERPRAARLLAYLCRARGDVPAARWAAERSGEAALLNLMLVECGDWKQLAVLVDARGGQLDDAVDDLGFAAAYHRLAGDAEGLEKYAKKIVALADRRPDDALLAAEVLFLNDRPEAGVEILRKRKAFASLAELLGPLGRYDELLALARDAVVGQSRDADAIQVRAALAMHTLGDSAGASAALERLLAEGEQANPGPRRAAVAWPDTGRFVLIAEAAAAIGRKDLAEECVARALASPRAADSVDDLLEAAGFAPGERAARWWRVLRERYKEPPKVTFGRLRSVMTGGLARAEAETLAYAAADSARRAEASNLDAALADIGDTLLAAGEKEAAANYFRRLADRPRPSAIGSVRLGDLEAEAGRWDTAASLYGRAWEIDRAQPLPLLLRGAALRKIGRGKEGDDLVALAHLLPLADDAARHTLMLELERRQMRDEARRERDLLLRTASFQSWYQSDALRRAGDEAYEKEDFGTAAAMWDRAFLDNNSRSTGFARLWANFAMPALIHRARAQGMIRAGDVAGGLREGEVAMRYSPSDSDSIIAVVNELDRAGKKAEADGFYRKYAAPYRALCEAHPNSAQAHNQLAWTQAKSRRELDDALAHAKRAVELDPKNTACIDTLAETYFQRGEVQNAIEQMNRCAELEPNEKRHQQQLERFNRALH